MLGLSSLIVLADFEDGTVGGRGPKLGDGLDDLQLVVLALEEFEIAPDFTAMVICCCGCCC